MISTGYEYRPQNPDWCLQGSTNTKECSDERITDSAACRTVAPMRLRIIRFRGLTFASSEEDDTNRPSLVASTCTLPVHT